MIEYFVRKENEESKKDEIQKEKKSPWAFAATLSKKGNIWRYKKEIIW